VMAAVSNGNILQMLGQFVDVVKRANVPNFLVVALDQRTADFLRRRGTPHYLRQLRSRTGSTDNHATSGLKFQILHELLSVGVSVLLSDVDIVVTSNPFLALYRDTDVEGMSDGWDDNTAYGHVHPLALPGGADELVSLRLVARNSGLFYLAATRQCLRLAKILADRMATEAVWDQSAYNMEIFRPAYGHRLAAGVSMRVMNYLCFLNTKLLFKYMRYDKQLIDPKQHLPVSCHVNYHPEKEARMVAISRYYLHGEPAALDQWNGGEGQRASKRDSCRGKVGVAQDSLPPLGPSDRASHVLVKNMLARPGDKWEWSGRGPVVFGQGGELASPWGAGSWGSVPSPWRKDSLHVKLGGDAYLLMFLSEKWAFVALRCGDEQVSYGRLLQDPLPPQRLVF